QELHSNSQEKDIRNRLVRMINRNINSDEDWQIFENNFNQIHKEFMDRLKAEFPELSAKDLQLAAYLRMGLQSKEIAPLLNVSDRSVDNNRYRLRKKLGLGSEDNLREFVMNY
ncbi:MAG: LuxR C-terminal-related transcriptional regulator, partial [Saprospiraceae bacterium]|nr:LuxR C-terminal-related transcriptional regulator [Saprospiraceae bacterium]